MDRWFILFLFQVLKEYEIGWPNAIEIGPESNASHSMAMGNLNKSKETMPTTTTSLKVAPQENIYHKN